jgi:hypothetical protein
MTRLLVSVTGCSQPLAVGELMGGPILGKLFRKVSDVERPTIAEA